MKKAAKSGLTSGPEGLSCTGEKLSIKLRRPSNCRSIPGTYTSDELDVTYTLYLDGEKLMVRVRRTPHPSRDVRHRHFRLIRVQTDLQAGSQPSNTGFTLDAGRVKKLVFEKRKLGSDALNGLDLIQAIDDQLLESAVLLSQAIQPVFPYGHHPRIKGGPQSEKGVIDMGFQVESPLKNPRPR